MAVAGKLFDASGTMPLADCSLEVWHLSPNSTKYNHRAKLRTNEAGEYSFITDRPNREKGRDYKIYFKLSQGEDYTLPVNELPSRVYYMNILSSDGYTHKQPFIVRK